MSINKYGPHVWIIPEDSADEQLANGFIQHSALDRAVAARAVQVVPHAHGWPTVIELFTREYISWLRRFKDHAHVVMLIDFDDKDIEGRKAHFDRSIPEDVKARVFVIGSKVDPEALQRELGMTRERIGAALAEDCLKKDFELWRHEHLVHNRSELERMTKIVKPILFQGK